MRTPQPAKEYMVSHPVKEEDRDITNVTALLVVE
jgi:hypothetical protein